MLSNQTPPFDDSVQLSEMQVDVSDDLPIVTDQELRDRPRPEMDEQTVMYSASGQPISKKKGYVIVAILFFINLLNYMDRFTVAGELVIEYFAWFRWGLTNNSGYF